MDVALSDADCIARSLSQPKAFEQIFDRLSSPSTRTCIDA
jgi:hypothetical protein